MCLLNICHLLNIIILKEDHSFVYMQKHTDTHQLEEFKHVSMYTHTYMHIFFHVSQNIHVAMKEMCVLTFECWLIFKPWFDLKEMASLNFTTIKFYFISTMEGCLPSVFPEIRNISNILTFKCLYESKGPWKRIQV